MLNITLYHLTAFLRSAHGAALQHQLRWTACVASEEGRKIPPGFLPIGVDMAKENAPGFDLIMFPTIRRSKFHDLRLAFHCGPDIEAELDKACAVLRWSSGPAPGGARLELPDQLRWSLHKGETDPILGWYAYGLGRRTPAFTLIGRGRFTPDDPLRTRLAFLARSEAPTATERTISLSTSAAPRGQAQGTQAEAG